MQILEEAITFDDVLLVPAYSAVLPRQVSLESRVSSELSIKVPIISAAMDTVTESNLAIAMAQEGGIGIIHKNMSPKKQADEVERVKKYESGVIRDPLTCSTQVTVKDVMHLMQKNDISGVPVVDGGQLVGLVTARDLRFENDYSMPIASIMTPKEALITVEEHASQEEIRALLRKHRIEKILVVDKNFKLRGLVTVKDIQKSQEYPNACKDDDERLRVGAAIGVAKHDMLRAEYLIEAGVDLLVVDTAHGHSVAVLDMVKRLKQHFPDTQLIGGNVATGDGAKALVEAGIDGVKVGIGPGSICTTRVVTGVGMPQITAIHNVATAISDSGVPIIADGGVRYSGDVAKAIAAGAHVVMIGNLFAGTHESPGALELYQGRSYKSYRGMGSIGAMSERYGSADRYRQDDMSLDKLVPEGVEGRVPYKGDLKFVMHQLMGGLRAAMGYTGAENIDTFRSSSKFVRVSLAGVREGLAHDVIVTKEPPNYRVDHF